MIDRCRFWEGVGEEGVGEEGMRLAMKRGRGGTMVQVSGPVPEYIDSWEANYCNSVPVHRETDCPCRNNTLI